MTGRRADPAGGGPPGQPAFRQDLPRPAGDAREVAVKRRIVAPKGELLTGATPTFGRYDFRFLLDTVRQLVRRGDEFERDEIVRAVAAHLGYGQVTAGDPRADGPRLPVGGPGGDAGDPRRPDRGLLSVF